MYEKLWQVHPSMTRPSTPNHACDTCTICQAEAEAAEHSLAADAINEANGLSARTNATVSHGGSITIQTRESRTTNGGGTGSMLGMPIAAGTAVTTQSKQSAAVKSKGAGRDANGVGRSSVELSKGSTGKLAGTASHDSATGGVGPPGAATGGVRIAGSGGSGNDPSSYVVARHVADFGNVVLGFTKKKAFRVVNTGKVQEMAPTF